MIMKRHHRYVDGSAKAISCITLAIETTADSGNAHCIIVRIPDSLKSLLDKDCQLVRDLVILKNPGSLLMLGDTRAWLRLLSCVLQIT